MSYKEHDDPLVEALRRRTEHQDDHINQLEERVRVLEERLETRLVDVEMDLITLGERTSQFQKPREVTGEKTVEGDQ